MNIDELQKLDINFNNYIEMINSFTADDRFMFYGGESYSDSNYSDTYSDNW